MCNGCVWNHEKAYTDGFGWDAFKDTNAHEFSRILAWCGEDTMEAQKMRKKVYGVGIWEGHEWGGMGENGCGMNS